jgi:hypothetical protein
MGAGYERWVFGFLDRERFTRAGSGDGGIIGPAGKNLVHAGAEVIKR